MCCVRCVVCFRLLIVVLCFVWCGCVVGVACGLLLRVALRCVCVELRVRVL